MIKILIDINVILDTWLERNQNYHSSTRLLSLCMENKLDGFLSANSYTTLHYLLSKNFHSSKATQLLKELRLMTKIIPLNEKIIDLALNSNWKDFEDSVQNVSATEKEISHIITQNKKDFRLSDLVIMTPAEFLASQNFN